MNEKSLPSRRRRSPVIGERLAEMVRLYQGGAGVSEIAREFGYVQNTVRNDLRAAGVKMRRVSPEERSTMVRLYQAGATVSEIARELGYATSTVDRHLSGAGIKWRPRSPVTGEQLGEMVRLYQSGANGPEIAREFGYATATVRKHLRAAGVQLRPRGSPKGTRQLTPEARAALAALHRRRYDDEPERYGAPTAEERSRMVGKYAEGATMRKIAREFGYAEDTVSKYLRAAGVNMRVRGVSPEERSTMVRLYQSGASTTKIAAATGYSHTTVINHLHAARVKMRPRSWRPQRERGRNAPLTLQLPT
jgi:transposase-like protein